MTTDLIHCRQGIVCPVRCHWQTEANAGCEAMENRYIVWPFGPDLNAEEVVG